MRRGDEITVEREAVEIGSGERAEVLHPVTGEEARAEERVAQHQVGDRAERSAVAEGLPEPEERVLPLVDDRRVERPERLAERAPSQTDHHLRETGAPRREVDVRERALELPRERVRGLKLAGEADRDADDLREPGRRARKEGAELGDERPCHVRVEGVVLGRSHALDLLLGEEPERGAVGGEVEVERVVGGRDGAEGGVDRARGRVVVALVEEALLVAKDGLGLADPAGDGLGVAARALQRHVPELLLVRERGLLLERGDPRLDARGDAGERTGLEQGVEGLEVRVDRGDRDAVRAEKAREHRHGEVRGRRVARGGINERDRHASR